MGDLIFFAKSIVFTFIIVILMQVKIGPTTLEEKAMLFATQSQIAQPITEVAQGGVVFIRQLWRNVTGNINSKMFDTFDNSNAPGHRSLGIQLKRSEKYIKNQSTEIKEGAEKHSRNFLGKVNDYFSNQEESVEDSSEY